MKGLATYTLIASVAFLASLRADAQPSRRDCSNFGDAEVDRVLINERTDQPLMELMRALHAQNRMVEDRPVPIVVELCNVELDLTGQSVIVASDRALIASPDCGRGPRKPGPLIRTKSIPPDRSSLFIVEGDNVVFAGLRLHGPSPDPIVIGDEHNERGIRIDPSASPLPIQHIEICNMDMFHWSGAAIDVVDTSTRDAERGRLFNTAEGAMRISNNFLRENRHGQGWGYGVSIGRGAYALIKHNVFDQNRHAISGDSSDGKKDFSGYSARENLILTGGGVHCSESGWFAISLWRHNCWQTHQIDMHGDKSWWRLGEYCCGTAGETMLIQRNTILYIGGSAGDLSFTRHGYAIKIRGNPADKAVVDGNVFLHYTPDDAISQNGDLVRHVFSVGGRARPLTASRTPSKCETTTSSELIRWATLVAATSRRGMRETSS